MSTALDETTKQQIIDAYEEASPTPETSMAIVQKLAEEFERAPQSIRMILTQAKVYVKSVTTKTTNKDSSAKEEKVGKKSKQASIDELKGVIKTLGQEVDDAILDKLTGKAAEYFITVLTSK